MSTKFPKLKNPSIVSPMAGVTDIAFRTLAKKYGAGMTYTEFVNSIGLKRGNQRTKDMIKIAKSEKPVGVQLFGKNLKDIKDAAQTVEDFFDVIDINCGCPAYKVIRTGAGSELLRDPNKLGKIINTIASSIQKPLTIKIRTGIDDTKINAKEIAKIAEDSGAAAIAIHGRTQKQGYQRTANWNIIKQVKESVNIPVIGNGDVSTPEIFKKRLKETNVDAIMIARGCIGNPYIFKQINDYLKTGKYKNHNNLEDLEKYIKLAEKYKLNTSAIKHQSVTFTKGIIGGKIIRDKIAKTKNIKEIRKIIIDHNA